MSKRFWLALALSLVASLAGAIPLADNLINYDSPQGQQLFAESHYKQNFWQLSRFYTTQQNLTYCGIASSVMVLNALQIAPPFDPVYHPYKIFTQDNIFSAKVVKAAPFYKVRSIGMTLAELAEMLAGFELKAEVFYADQLSIEQFRRLAKQAVSEPNKAILVNYLRTKLNQQGGGHISPLAAYDENTDRFLLLDVARFKYPPVWIRTAELWDAMKTVDNDAGKMRGFVAVEKR
jgi:hypothetical protein